MSESKDGRANIDRMTNHLIKQGMDSGKAKETATNAQVRKDLRTENGGKNWRKPYGSE